MWASQEFSEESLKVKMKRKKLYYVRRESVRLSTQVVSISEDFTSSSFNILENFLLLVKYMSMHYIIKYVYFLVIILKFTESWDFRCII